MEERVDAAPAAGGPPWRLAELVSIETLQSIQDTFAIAFGLPTVIVDPDGEPASEFTNRLAFCEDLTRSSALGASRCASCQGSARAEALASGSPSLYRCWNGLYDAAIPIAPKGEVVGYFLCGQVFAEAPDAERYRAVAAELGVDPDAYLAGLADVRVVPREQHEATVRSMHVLARLIGEQAAAAIDNLAILEQAREAESNAASHVEQLQVVLDCVRELSRQSEPRRTLEVLGDGVVRLLGCDVCAIQPRDGDGRPGGAAIVRPGGASAARLAAQLDPEAAETAAASGEPARFVDWRRSRHGVAVPLVAAGRCLAVLVASRPGRALSDRELEVAAVLSRQAAASLELVRVAADADAGRRREALLAGLVGAADDGDAAAVADRSARAAVELLDAEAAAVFVGDEAVASVGVGAELMAPLLEAVRAGRARAGERPELSRWNDGALLVLRVAAGAEPVDLAAVRHDDREWDSTTARAISAGAAAALERVRARERLERAARRDDRLAELLERLAEAADAEDVERVLLEQTAALVGADVAAVASIDGEQPGVVRIRAADVEGVVETAIALEGPPRVAAVRLRGGRQPRAVFDAWAAEALAALSSLARTEHHLAEPLHGRSGTHGAVLCGWRAEAPRTRVDANRRRLKLVANAAAGALSRFLPPDRTHGELRARVDELEAVAKLAARIARADDEAAVLGGLLEVASEAGGFDGTLFAVRAGDGWKVRRVAGLGEAAVAEGLRAAAEAAAADGFARIATDDRAETVAVVSDDRAAMLVGRRPLGNGRLDRVLPRLLADAAAALARVDAGRDRIETIVRLERERTAASGRLERAGRALELREALAAAALEGLDPLAAALAAALGGAAAVVASDGRELAREGEAAGPAWKPPQGAGPPRPVSEKRGDRRLVAAPAAVGGATLAWVVSEGAADDAAAVRAAVEHAAVLAASRLLRERAALEVEMRIRGGFVDDVCARRAPDEELLAQGRMLGIDLTAPSRVLLVEPPETGTPPDGGELYDAVAACASTWPAPALVASRGRGVAVIFAEADGAPFEERLRDALAARFPGLALGIAVGTSCRSVGDYARSSEAARHALELMRAVGRNGETFSFRDETFETLLLQASDPAALVRFVDRYVGPIERADRARTSELRRTLETYFACGRNLQETARRLHVHVSTLRYRLSRACALAGVEPKDERAMLDLQLALAAAATLPRRAGDAAS